MSWGVDYILIYQRVDDILIDYQLKWNRSATLIVFRARLWESLWTTLCWRTILQRWGHLHSHRESCFNSWWLKFLSSCTSTIRRNRKNETFLHASLLFDVCRKSAISIIDSCLNFDGCTRYPPPWQDKDYLYSSYFTQLPLGGFYKAKSDQVRFMARHRFRFMIDRAESFPAFHSLTVVFYRRHFARLENAHSPLKRWGPMS